MGPLVFYIVTGLLGAGVEVRVAPDQPAPIFFTDEPLLIEVTAAEAMRCAGSLYAELPDGTAVQQSLELPALSPDAPVWVRTTLPQLRGTYRIYVNTDCPTGTQSTGHTVVRVNRPTAAGATRLGIASETWSDAAAYGVRCMSAHAVRFDVATPNLSQTIDAALRIGRCRVHVRVRAEAVSAGHDIAQIARKIGDRVDMWEISGVAGPQDFATLAESIRGSNPAAQLAAVVLRPQEAPAYLSVDSNLFPDALVVSGTDGGAESLEPFMRAVERAGYERFPLILDVDGSAGAEPAAARMRVLLMDAARRFVDTVFVPQGWLYSDGGFTPAYAQSAWAGAALYGAKPLGGMALEGDHQVWIARLTPGDPTGDWLMGVQTGSEAACSIYPGEDAAYEVLDAYGNPVQRDPGHERNIVLASGDFWFVRGTGGELIEQQLIARIRSGAASVLADEALAPSLPPEAAAALAVLKDYAYPAPARFEFFALLRSLPEIEDRWHRGVVETRIAVPLVKRLAQIAADVAVLEQDLGEAYLEPLDKTLGSCALLLDRYLEPEEPSPFRQRRVDFLRAEIARLIAEARAWYEAGRTTEAKALAALAEWRARCLAPAATAKRVPEPEASPDSDAEAPAEPEDETDSEENA